jgi:hypothetical protein
MTATNLHAGQADSVVPLLPAAELLSFLRQTHGAWTERDLSKALNISFTEAKQAVAAIQLQGFVEPIGRTQKWRTTEEGVTVSGAKTARFTRKAVEQALSALRDRIQAINHDPDAEYEVSEAVGFGDFLSDQARVQAADVGIRLTPRKSDSEVSGPALARLGPRPVLVRLHFVPPRFPAHALTPLLSE